MDDLSIGFARVGDVKRVVGEFVKERFGANDLTLRPDEETRALLPTSPPARRAFPQNDVIALFAEVYDDGRVASHEIDIGTTIATDDGRVVFKNEEVRESAELRGKRGAYGYTARVPLAGLAPGPYVLAVEARSRLSNTPPAVRRMRVTVTPPVSTARP